jgi:tetrahydromethanopterin S-methyltransferase subunit G
MSLSADAIQDIGNLLDDKLDERDRKLDGRIGQRDRALHELLGLHNRKLNEKLDEIGGRIDERLEAISQDLIGRLEALARTQPALASWLQPPDDATAPHARVATPPLPSDDRFDQIERRLTQIEELLGRLRVGAGIGETTTPAS